MQIAINHAWKFQTLTLPNPAVGALILFKNTIIALEVHFKAGFPHAEVLACKQAFITLAKNDKQSQQKILQTLSDSNDIGKINQVSNSTQGYLENFSDDTLLKSSKNLLKDSPQRQLENLIQTLEHIHDSHAIHDFITTYHSGIFYQCDFFVTLEPCNHYGRTPPCANLLKTIKPKRIVIGHKDINNKAQGGSKTLQHIHLTQHILESQAKVLLYPFLQYYKKKSFLLFKVAHRLNGDYKNGQISNQDSRILTHNMRCIADNIIISGKTLREDNPLLDTRFAQDIYKQNSKLPTIYILTKTMQKKDIEKYRISNRKVFIIKSITDIPKHGFSVIEGGFEFLTSILQEIKQLQETQQSCLNIDCILGYIAPNFLSNNLCIHAMNSPVQNDKKDIAEQNHLNKFDKNNNIYDNEILTDFYLAYTQSLENSLHDPTIQDSNNILCFQSFFKEYSKESLKNNASLPQNIKTQKLDRNVDSKANIIYWLFRKIVYDK
ncbi:bifunctional diaminohydroxyphosphoribosylaminopyrimidine deaminase/5-amino-6-(5-phosphoribosylamino)uracil reductase RibD [Helicobacter didelphidarum]|uniref:Bifunctional diaminohydroxyphosphoribosylaminopyrimidine deaminase/5-amino-6-(5-phosphoribosylamino)uracil reductase RibD n=2 Tax=Helicobacter didelphidarum TaxID=2040648 RepID=A0A3D8INW4_9HELI|nr:bifunctional diaminohydroxyphosphoribosylaminopyrimidine deaminase/5-amino-6-(5-phosphoribosylamino)uracil reductase RibD [Helicobacter didelphidarum]